MRRDWNSGEGEPWPLADIFRKQTGLFSGLPVGKQVKEWNREPHCLNTQDRHKVFRVMVGIITGKNYYSLERLQLHCSSLFYIIL